VSAFIVDSNAVCSVGRGVDQIWASVRTGISRIADSRVMDRRFNPIQMSLVAEDALPPLAPELDALPLPPRARRMLRLGAPMLASVAERANPEALRLFLGVPRIDAKQDPWITSFALHLAKMAAVTLDTERCRVFPAGRAAGLIALEAALAALAADPASPVVVGGIDTFFDMRLLAALDAQDRVLGKHVMDGFIPGEGAAFLVLAAKPGAARAIQVRGAASVRDPGHREGTEPARGEGLSQALDKLRANVGALPAPVGVTFAGFNGESFEAKLWGVAALRHKDLFDPQMQIQHPADCFGDTGAACGTLLTALCANALLRGDRSGPALVWAASDHEPRSCALLEG
jgi:3-oxoacyl-[acyl-carrier-protein] synthase I